MQSDQLIEITKAMKLEILNIILNADLSNDTEAQRVILTIDNMFDRLDIAVEEVIPEDALRSYFEGVDEATKALRSSGVNPIGGVGTSISSSGRVRSHFSNHVHMAAIAEVTDDTMLDLKAAIRTARQNTYFTLQTTLADVKEELQRGILHGDARRTITQRVTQAFSDDGLTAFITSDNRRLPLDFYAETVVRTNLKRANTNGALNRYAENGVRYVTVTGGTPTCHQCTAYRDIVFSLVEGDPDFPYLPPDTFPLHPNCNCSLRPYVIEYKTQSELDAVKKKASKFNPEKDIRSKSQKDAYEKQQRLHRINNYEKKRYADIKGLLGDDAPANLGAFKRMKRANSENYQMLLQDYQDALKSIKG